MTASAARSLRPRFWPTVLAFSLLHFGILWSGVLLVEPFSGGCMFISPGYFIVLVVVLPILKLRRFGAGTAVFLLYFLGGLYPTYSFEWQTTHSLISPWGVLAGCLAGPLVGLAALYRDPAAGAHFRFFTDGVYFTLPWLLANGALAGYTAHALAQRV